MQHLFFAFDQFGKPCHISMLVVVRLVGELFPIIYQVESSNKAILYRTINSGVFTRTGIPGNSGIPRPEFGIRISDIRISDIGYVKFGERQATRRMHSTRLVYERGRSEAGPGTNAWQKVSAIAAKCQEYIYNYILLRR